MIGEQKRKFEKVEAFIAEMNLARVKFPEHAREIDGAIFRVLKKVFAACPDRNCACKMSFEQFHAAQNATVEQLKREISYEFN